MVNIKQVKSGFVQIPDARLAYEMAGEGEPIVLLHGGFLDARMWDAQFVFLAQHYRVIRYDMRCAGSTETLPTTEPYSHYQDLYHFLHALHIQQATLVGLSGGALAAIDFAITYPEMVQRLVVVSPGMSGYQFRDAWVHKWVEGIGQSLAQKDIATAIEVQLVAWVDGPYRTPEQVDPIMREHCREMVANALPLTRLAPNARYLTPPAAGRLAEIHAPTLVVLGDKDTPDILTIGKMLHEGVAGAELVTIPDVAHTLVMEKPDEFNTVVERFLRG